MKPSVRLITSSELSSAMSAGERLSIIDARPREDYHAAHVPGAVWVGWECLCAPPPVELGPTAALPGYWGVLAEKRPEAWARELSLLGLTNDRRVVVYADSVLSKGREGRVAWMLLYLGANNVSLLDGGWSGWLANGHRTEAGPAATAHGDFEVTLREDRRTRVEALRTLYRAKSMPVMIDVRSAGEFEGSCFDYMPRMGRLPESVLLPFASLFDSDGRFVSQERYLALMPDQLRQAANAVLYCEVGVRAGVASVLHEVHTGQVLPVYDGSMMEWSAIAELPVH